MIEHLVGILFMFNEKNGELPLLAITTENHLNILYIFQQRTFPCFGY